MAESRRLKALAVFAMRRGLTSKSPSRSGLPGCCGSKRATWSALAATTGSCLSSRGRWRRYIESGTVDLDKADADTGFLCVRWIVDAQRWIARVLAKEAERAAAREDSSRTRSNSSHGE